MADSASVGWVGSACSDWATVLAWGWVMEWAATAATAVAAVAVMVADTVEVMVADTEAATVGMDMENTYASTTTDDGTSLWAPGTSQLQQTAATNEA